MLSLFINNSPLYQHVVVPHTLVAFEAWEVSDWERAHDAVIALLWEGQPNIMGPGRIRELFSDPVRLYSLFMFLLRLPYHPSAAVSQQVPCVFQKSLKAANGQCVLFVCMYVVLYKVHTHQKIYEGEYANLLVWLLT
jgi:hypothetical protein